MNDGALSRNAVAGDLNYIFATTLRDMRDADGSALPDEDWFPAHRAYLERTLADPAVECRVLCAWDDHNEILGYCISRPEKELIWCHVRKGPLRRRGLAKRLLSEARVLGSPAAWTTPLGRVRLRNPWRGRQLRASSRSSGARRASSASSPGPRSPAVPSTS